MQHLICHRKRFGKSGLGVGNAKEILIGYYNQRIYFSFQCLNASISRAHTPRAFKIKRLGDNANR